MAKRWLKIDVTRTEYSQVYVGVDDELVPLTPIVGPCGEAWIDLTRQVRDLGEAAADVNFMDHEWGDAEMTAGPAVEVSEDEAEQHVTYDVSQLPEKYLPQAKEE